MSIRSILLKNAGAGAWSKVSIILVRIVQVPLLLSILGVDDFGRWTVLYSLPSWLNLTNMGFGNVAANDMAMSSAAGGLPAARQAFATASGLILAIGVVGIGLISAVVPFLPWCAFLKAPVARHDEIVRGVLFLSASIFVTFFLDVSLGRFRAARKTHTSVLICSFFPWIDLLALMVTLPFTHRFDFLGLSLLGSTLVCCVVYQWLSRRAIPSIVFNLRDFRRERLPGLFRKGLAFQAFPLGNALLYQASIMIVQAVLGPASVAIYSTTRTLVRTVNQSMELVNASIWPELSRLFGLGELKKASRLHRVSVEITLLLSFGGVLFLAIFGPWLYHLWVGKSLTLSRPLMIVFLLPIPFNALWFTSSVVHMATNQHAGLARRYLGAALLSAISCYFLARFAGLEGAALSSLVMDLLLIPYVLKHSLYLTGDSWHEFIRGRELLTWKKRIA
jgi:O-antigen/teichoic acid export membrane protein